MRIEDSMALIIAGIVLCAVAVTTEQWTWRAFWMTTMVYFVGSALIVIGAVGLASRA